MKKFRIAEHTYREFKIVNDLPEIGEKGAEINHYQQNVIVTRIIELDHDTEPYHQDDFNYKLYEIISIDTDEDDDELSEYVAILTE